MFHSKSILCALTVLVVTSNTASSSNIESDHGRQLQDCTDMEAELVKPIPYLNPVSLAIEDTCSCSETLDATYYTCAKNKACLSWNDTESFQGDFSDVYSQEKGGTSYTQTTAVTTCFHYPEGMFNGSNVCLTYYTDGLGTVATCSLSVGDETCTVCRFCQVSSQVSYVITYDCSNIGYDDRSGCVAGNEDGSLVQFLSSNIDLASDCPADKSPSSSPGTSSAFGLVASMMMTLVVSGLFPSMWMVV
eukprot:Nitzschia sp. Nitz4//scaffold71_size96697//3759//4499//NITZ4_004684-RA/size96697-processed-gene-0.124-mRNA-1//-1//CDS//3329557214//196//frame0